MARAVRETLWFTGLEAAVRPVRMEGETHLPLQASPIEISMACRYPGERLQGNSMDYATFITQKVILRFMLPVSVCLAFLAAALLVRRKRRIAFALVLFAWVWLFLAALPLTGLLLVRTLETDAGPYLNPKVIEDRDIRHIVVLSGGFRQGDLSAADQLGISVLRVLEAVRLRRSAPSTVIVLTGGEIPGLSGDTNMAEAQRRMLAELGVPDKSILLEKESWTTEDQAKRVAPIVGDRPFVLVTSAFHMPRSLLIFRAEGLKPVAAPADFLAKAIPVNYETLIPTAYGLSLTQIAIKEYLAAWWFRIRHRLL